MQQPIPDFDDHLITYIDCINITVKWNKKIKEYEALKIETPQNIKDILKKLNISSSFLIIASECVAIGKSINYSNNFLYQMFFIKSMYRIVYETFNFINVNGKFIFSIKNEKTNEINYKIKQFRKKYSIEKIGKIRNKIAAHYTDDFSEHINLMLEIDSKESMEMHYEFIELQFEVSNFVIHDFHNGKVSTEIKEYFKLVEKELMKIGSQK